MRIGLCGLGSAAHRAHLPALSRATETGAASVTAVTDPDPDRRAAIAARTGALPYPDVHALVAGGVVDLLVVASPPSSHLEAVSAALERGIDVLCEKPLGIAVGDAQALADLCARHPTALLAPVHQYRFAPSWRRIEAEASAALAAGEPLCLEVEVERPGTDPLSAGGWRAAGLREGDILGDHAVHYLALAWTLGGSPRVVDADLSGEPGRSVAHVLLDLGRSDATVRISASAAGQRRRNLVAVELPARGRRLRWLDAELELTTAGSATDDGEPATTTEPTPSLSDRQAVNDLYGALYDELLACAADPGWRRQRVEETLSVAALLDKALSDVR